MKKEVVMYSGRRKDGMKKREGKERSKKNTDHQIKKKKKQDRRKTGLNEIKQNNGRKEDDCK